MGNPRASSNLAPGTTMGPLSFREGTLSYFLAKGIGRAKGGRVRMRRLGAGARRGGLGDDADQADREAVLGANLVPRAAVLAADVRAARVFAQVKDLGRSKELRAPEALYGGVAHQLGHLGHCGSSVIRMGVALNRAWSYGGIVGAPGGAVQPRAVPHRRPSA
jgi:hypothetical protein